MSKLVWNTKKAITPTSLDSVGLDLLRGRGMSELQAKSFIRPSYDKDLGDPMMIEGMDRAVNRIAKAIKNDEKVYIYGDYDIDGISASALLYDAFTQMGLNASLYIPDRFEEGYGLNSKALKKLKDDGASLVISVDCGTTAHKQADYSKKIGLKSLSNLKPNRYPAKDRRSFPFVRDGEVEYNSTISRAI